MTTIQIHETDCLISQEPNIKFLWRLDQELSFKVQGSEHTRAYKGYFDKEGKYVRWDGMHRLLTEQLRYPIGLLSRVIDFYKSNNLEITTLDCRAPKTIGAKIDILPKLQNLNKSPYPYQLQTLAAIQNKDHGIIRLATGAGKQLVATLIIAELGKSAIFYVIGTDLLYQAHKFLSQVFECEIGLIGDGHCEIKDINVASVWTVGQALGLDKSKIISDSDFEEEHNLDPQKYKNIRQMLKTTKVHIFDECHLCACDTIRQIAQNINPDHLYGMSASPWRDDNADLLIEGILGKNIIDISASDLIEQGYLAQPFIKFRVVPPIDNLPLNYKTIYKQYVTDNPVRNQLVVNGASKLVELGYQTLISYNNVSHGELLFKECLSKKIPTILLSGKDSIEIRESAKRKLENGDIKCIIASRIFDIGVDLPSLSGLVIAGAGKSSVRALQRIGRTIRKYPGKKNAAIIDFQDQAPYLKDHALERYKIYSSERKFEITWPT